MSRAHGAVLGCSESSIGLVVEDRNFRFQLSKQIAGSIGRGIIDDDDLPLSVSLLPHRLQASTEISGGIVGRDENGNHEEVGLAAHSISARPCLTKPPELS